jgi:hypothetical protein
LFQSAILKDVIKVIFFSLFHMYNLMSLEYF